MNWNSIVIFAAGAAIGSAVTYKLLKDKFAKIAQEEIDSVKEVFRKKADIPEEEEKPTIDELNENKEPINYNKIVEEIGYVKKEEKGGSDMTYEEPFIIEPKEYAESEYETTSLTYYADGVLEDEFGEILEDVVGTIGKESLTYFGKYDDDCVYVRNNRLMTDYEILRDPRTYAEANKVNPNGRGHA